MIGISWLVSHEVCVHIQCFFGVVKSKRRFKTSNKRRSKFQKRNMSCELALNFDQWKTFSKNYKPIRVWLWLLNKFSQNYCRSRIFYQFIQTQKRYPTSIDKVCILAWKRLVISCSRFCCELNSQKNYSSQNISVTVP